MEYLQLAAEFNNFPIMLEFVFSKIGSCDQVEKQIINQLRMACEEIFVNIVSYAYPNQEGEITIGCEQNSGYITIKTIDQGKPFNPLIQNDPDMTSEIQDRCVGGLGIYMVKQLMDEICYKRENNENILIMQKKFAS